MINSIWLANYKLFKYNASLRMSNILKDMRVQRFQMFEASNMMWPQV